MAGLSDETRRLLELTSTATLTTQLFKRGLRNTFVQGVRRLTPGAPVMVGEAFTLRMIPAREDLDHPGLFTDRHPQRRAIEECRRIGLPTACRSTQHLLMRWWTDMS